MEAVEIYKVELENICKNIIRDLGLPPKGVINTVCLLDDMATIPFIARYRKERTGGLDETQIRGIQESWKYYLELENRKVQILESINKQGKLTAGLFEKIKNCVSKPRLEDLYLPYKQKKHSRSAAAREKGLEPLAELIIEQKDTAFSREDILSDFVDSGKDVNSMEDALAGAMEIVVERIVYNAEIRSGLRNFFTRRGVIVSRVNKDWEGKKSKYEMYYDFSEPLKDAASHRLLAIRRGTAETVISWKIEIDEEIAIDFIASKTVTNEDFVFAKDIKKACINAYKRLYLSLEIEVFTDRMQQAEEEAIEVFSRNLRNLLLEPPAGHKVIMGIDPGFRTGCKVAVIDRYGNFMDYQPVFPHPPQSMEKESRGIILSLIEKFGVELIAIGDGTASRETFSFVNKILPGDRGIKIVMVSEAGASVYSASEVAIREFPDLDVTVKGAISIGRRLQDPLSELVKIDPKSIGVGQYQHDVNPYKLKESLRIEVESCVNFVGVEINTASRDILSYVSGVGESLARNIIHYRSEHGPFKCRENLREVPMLGRKSFEQCAGFLRVRDSIDPLDNTTIHPESYPIVEKMAADLNVSTADLIGNAKIIDKISLARYVSGETGIPTLKDIVKELRKPGHDPRSEFTNIEFSAGIERIEDLKDGMEFTGRVTNVTNFGAFVDIGVHQDGLIHISNLSARFIKTPHEVVSVGDRIKVRVLSVDTELKRISLEKC
ncbi:MAG: Tex family protein [Candidatus Omnitrophota bacterium]